LNPTLKLWKNKPGCKLFARGSVHFAHAAAQFFWLDQVQWAPELKLTSGKKGLG
jgi:hypothetical protein